MYQNLILMNPFNLIESMTRDIETSVLSDKEKQDLLNQMWRNASLSDTYEPGSSFKIVTAAGSCHRGRCS